MTVRASVVGLAGLASLAGVAFAGGGCHRDHVDVRPPNAIVGTWLVHDPNAPFPEHLYVFNGDGTMQQANPDAGDPHGSDSDGKGVWVADGDRIRGKWVELLADRTTHRYTGRLEISYELRVTGDTYSGTEVLHPFDASGHPTDAPATPAALAGRRVTSP